MPGDDELARLLPEPPPPRAARREAAIDAAMRRFDGEGAAAAAAPPSRTVRSGIGRPQVAAFASVALVAVVGIPLAMNALRQEHQRAVAVHQPVTAERAAPPAGGATEPAGAANPAPVKTALDAKPEAVPPPALIPPPPPERDCGKGECADIVEPQPIDRFAALKPARPAAPALAPPQVETATAGLVAIYPEPPAPPSAKADDARDVVVTGSRASLGYSRVAPAEPRRQINWNPCTVDASEHSMAECGALIDPGAEGDKGRAAARVADGLAQAWRGDLSGAIDDFSAAIKSQPRLAIAYLNRGLTYRRLGDKRRALADLNKAVRLAPRMAQAYYNRALIRRDAGDTGGADADFERAGEIDATYRPSLD